MSSSDAAGKTSSSRADDTDRSGQVSAGLGQNDPLKFANPDLIDLFRSAPWAPTLGHPAREFWRTTAPGMLSEASLSEPYMVVAAAEFGSVLEFFLAVDEVDNFFSEVCMTGEDALCLALPARPDALFIFAKRSALIRIGVPLG